MGPLSDISVRPVMASDLEAWLAMRLEFWPEGSEREHREEMQAFLSGAARGRPEEVLVAENGRGEIVGIVELAIRPYAEGCSTDRVAYLEGWFVRPEARRQGIGSALIAAAEEWARRRGCAEFASDTDPDNLVSIAAHRASGFDTAGLVLCFCKKL